MNFSKNLFSKKILTENVLPRFFYSMTDSTNLYELVPAKPAKSLPGLRHNF